MPLTPVLLLLSTFVVQTPVAQTPAPTGATPVWTARFSGDIRWQQVTPAGALLVSTDNVLAAVDIERGQIVWQKPELGGLPADSVRMVEGSLLMEAARPGLLVVFDPVTGTVLFDSRRLNLTKVVTRRVLPQTGTLLVHGQRQSGPPVVALYDLATGTQTTIGYWDQLAASYIEEHQLDERSAAHIYALMNAAAMDAEIGCWDAKYTYYLIRPPQADKLITLVINMPNHPSYPSGHSCVSAAAVGVLESFLRQSSCSTTAPNRFAF